MRRAARATMLVALAALLLACSGGDGGGRVSASRGSGTPTASGERGGTTSAMDRDLLTGEWRVYSQTLFYDAGGSGGADASSSSTTRLRLGSDGTWRFGRSRGTWRVAPTDDDAWERWGVEAYGPEMRVVLDGWGGEGADGPIETDGGRVDFLWVIYRVEEPSPGTVQMKFGRP